MPRQLVGRHEPVPLVRADRQPAQHVLAADDGQQVGLQRAVEGRQQHQPARPHQRRAGLQERATVGHVLDHLQADDRVEGRPSRRQVLHAPGAIVDVEPLAGGMPARRLDVLRAPGRAPSPARPGAPAARRSARRRSRRRARASPASGRSPACGQGEVADHLVAQEGQPRRPDLVQGAELAARVPPFARPAARTGRSRRRSSVAPAMSPGWRPCCMAHWRAARAVLSRPSPRRVAEAGLVAKSTRVKPP